MDNDKAGEELKTSSEETIRSDGVDDDFGHGQSYECVFCKRGFPTAQALGGHMNIHRRDRARLKQPRTSRNPSRAIEEDQTATGAYEVIPHPNYTFPYSLDSSRNHSRNTHDQATNSVNNSRESPTSNLIDMLNSQCLDSDRNDYLGLRLGNLDGYDHTRLRVEDQGRRRQDLEEGGDELDLELRLGHYP